MVSIPPQWFTYQTYSWTNGGLVYVSEVIQELSIGYFGIPRGIITQHNLNEIYCILLLLLLFLPAARLLPRVFRCAACLFGFARIGVRNSGADSSNSCVRGSWLQRYSTNTPKVTMWSGFIPDFCLIACIFSNMSGFVVAVLCASVYKVSIPCA